MPRRVQDIVPGDDRSIRNIPVERGTRSEIKRTRKTPAKTESPKKEKPIEKIEQVVEDRDGTAHIPIRQSLISASPPERRKSSAPWWIFVTVVVAAVIFGIGYIASVYFSRATFTVVPRSVPLSIDSTYIAQNNASTGVLPYELIVVESTASTTVPATDSTAALTKAQGKITIYNTYSAEAQRLIAGTRLANDSGKIYRTAGSVTVPGGSQANPGTAVVSVTADAAGAEYNLSKSDRISDFRVVAFKGTPRYSGFYARLASDISGGFSGTKKVVNPTLMASTTEMLRASLTSALVAKAKESVPAGYLAYDAGLLPSFSAPTVSGNDPKQATIAIKATVYGILFKRDALVSRLAGSEADVFEDYDYDAAGLETLQFSIANAKDFSPAKKNTLIAKLKGDVKLVATVPAEELKTKLAGLPLDETQKIFSAYSTIIKTGTGELVPPWSKVPEDKDRISITIEDDE